MAQDWQLQVADESARLFSRQYGMPPTTGRVLGWLLVCDPPQQSISEVIDRLSASRTAVTTAVNQLEAQSWVTRSRLAGERMDRVRLHPDAWSRILDNQNEFTALREFARRSLAIAGDEADARLVDLAAFADFLAERMPALVAEWEARRPSSSRP